MKTLIIFRHGKAELHRADLDDYDRCLTERGKKNAFEMGRYIAQKIGTPNLVLTSSAKRAHETAILAAEGMNYSFDAIRTDRELYFASPKWMMRSLSSIHCKIDSCVLVGHNPGLTDLVNDLGVRLDNLPTASAVCFQFDTDSWEDISSDNARFQWIKLAREL